MEALFFPSMGVVAQGTSQPKAGPRGIKRSFITEQRQHWRENCSLIGEVVHP